VGATYAYYRVRQKVRMEEAVKARTPSDEPATA